MSPGTGFFELVFVFGVALALGLWELWRVRRDIRRTRDFERDKRSSGGDDGTET